MSAPRRVCRAVRAGGLIIGGEAKVSVQSMTNTPTSDVEATLAQIRRLYEAGCDLVRVSVYDMACADAVRALVDGSPCPLAADVHFDHRLAIRSLENGIAKLRINPGNIGGERNVRLLADCLKVHHAAVRVGVNSGSLEKDILEKHGGVTAEGMVESALRHARMLEDEGFFDIVLSLKASDVRRTVDAYRLVAEKCDYPLHLGVTEAGGPGMGHIKSAIGIGSLLLDGIGDTIRVSLTGAPEPEASAGLDILRALDLRDGVDIISCPTCGRTEIDVAGVSERVREATARMDVQLKVAVMGCIVNGPGEAREADLGIAGGRDGGALFVRGRPVRTVKGDLAQALIEAIEEYTGRALH